MKKYLAVLAGIIMQLCLGGVYAWSAFVPSLVNEYGYSFSQTQMIFGFEIGLFTAVSILTGRLHDRRGPRLLGMASGILILAEYLLASLCTANFSGLFFSISVVGGCAIACGYVCPIATGIKWFPHHKGLITGLAVAGYGGGGFVLSQLVEFLLGAGWQIPEIMRLVGLIYGPVVFVCGILLFTPARDEHHEHQSVNYRDVLQTKTFWALSIGIFCATFPGLVLIGNLKSIGLELGITSALATSAIGTLSIGNAAGRIIWGQIHDRHTPRTVAIISLVTIIASAPLLYLSTRIPGGFLLGAAILGFCFGGGLSIYPSQTALNFGAENMGKIYPLVLLTHGLAGMTGASLGGYLRDLTGNYTLTFMTCIIVPILGLTLYALLYPGRRDTAAG